MEENAAVLETPEVIKHTDTEWYRDVSLEDAEVFIRSNLQSAVRSVIATGFYLKHIRDNELYLEAGYKNINEYAMDRFGLSASATSRYITRNTRFSRGGNSPLIDDRFKDFSKSQLQEMLGMSDEQLEQVTPDMTVREIRSMARPKEIPYIEIPGQTELKDIPGVMPEEKTGSFETSTAELFDVEEDEPEVAESVVQPVASKPISQEIPVTELMEEKETEIATSQILPEKVATSDQPEKHYPENLAEWAEYEEKIDESYNFGDLPAAKEALLKRLAMLLVKRRFACLVGGAERISVENVRRNLIGVQEAEALDLGEGIEAAACAELIEFYRDTEDLGICTYERFTTQVKKCMEKEIEKRIASADDADKDPKKTEENSLQPIEYDLPTLKDMIQSDEKALEQMRDYWIRDQPYTYAKYFMRIQALKLLMQTHEQQEEYKVPEEENKPEQPELPRLKNNDQRAAFIDAYETWPLWIDNQETGERYYRYDLPDGTSFVIKTYHSMLYDWKADVAMRYKEGYGANEEYLLEPGKFFRDCRANRTTLIEKLKEMQKEGKR